MTTQQKTLNWLAENVEEWPSTSASAVAIQIEITDICGECCLDYSGLGLLSINNITREQWEEARFNYLLDQIEIPEGYEYKAVDKNGQAWVFTREPIMSSDMWSAGGGDCVGKRI